MPIPSGGNHLCVGHIQLRIALASNHLVNGALANSAVDVKLDMVAQNLTILILPTVHGWQFLGLTHLASPHFVYVLCACQCMHGYMCVQYVFGRCMSSFFLAMLAQNRTTMN